MGLLWSPPALLASRSQALLAPSLLLRAAVLLRWSLSPPLASRPPPLLASPVTAAMAAVQERSGSPVAVLGYTPAYPIGNILLTTCGTIIVVVMAS